MIQQLPFCIYAQKNWKQGFGQIFVHPSSWQCYLKKPKSEATQVFIDRWTDEQNVLHIYKRILVSLKKEEHSGICYTTDKPWRYYAKKNKPVTKGRY